VAEVVEPDVGGNAGPFEVALEGAHRGVPPADLALRVGEDEAGTAQEVETDDPLTRRALSRAA
jgi:hypothetical protein